MRKGCLFLAAFATVLAGCSSTLMHTEPDPVQVSVRPPAPPPPAPLARIEVDEQIHFAHESARIRQDSYSVVEEVARIIKDHPEIQRIRIEGHTDRTGNRRFNRRLSQRRAEAVRERLIEYGVSPERLEAQGFGQEQPIADNSSPEGRSQNRRVEFIVVTNEEG